MYYICMYIVTYLYSLYLKSCMKKVYNNNLYLFCVGICFVSKCYVDICFVQMFGFLKVNVIEIKYSLPLAQRQEELLQLCSVEF